MSDAIAERRGGIGVSFTAVSYGDVQGAPLLELPTEYVSGPVTTVLQAHLATVRAAARHMVKRGSGVIMTITGYGPPFPSLGGTAVAWALVEALYRQWATELGPLGVRVAWLRTGGFEEAILGAASSSSLYNYSDGGPVPLSELAASSGGADDLAELEGDTMLGRLPNLADAGAAAAFLASDKAVIEVRRIDLRAPVGASAAAVTTTPRSVLAEGHCGR